MTTIDTLHKPHGLSSVQSVAMPAGSTIEEIAVAVHGTAESLVAFLRAPLGHVSEWIEVPRALWRHIRPKVSDAVLIGYRPGKSVLKSVFAIVAAVIVSVVAPYLTAAFGSAILGGLASAALGVGLSLLGNLLFPAERPPGSPGAPAEEQARSFRNVDSDSNVLAKEAYLPIIAGIRRVSPPEIAIPRYSVSDGVQTISRIFALDGHHAISDVQVDDAPVTGFSAITTQVVEGAEASPTSTFVNKVSNNTSVREELSSFSADALVLVDQEEPANSEPRWVRFTTVFDERMEEIIIRLQVDSFLKTDDASARVRVPVRLRFREKGTAGEWFNLPEVHIVGRDISTSLREIRLRWDNTFGAEDTVGDLTYDFFRSVPAAAFTLSDGSTGVQWAAHSSFSNGSGLRDTKNITGRRNGLRIVLDPEAFPKKAYEWEVMRGAASVSNALNVSNYVLSGAVNSLFRAKSVSSRWELPVDQGALIARLSVVMATTLVNRQPCQRPGTALIAMRSRGQTVNNVTVLAGRYVRDWDGSGWSVLTTTKNPAVHYRQILWDYLTYHGIDTSLIDEASFVAWRQECIERGYEVSAVFSGQATRDALDLCAAAGFARARFSDGFGVDFFRDRSPERPKQTFSPRNARIAVEWQMDEQPVGIRAKFQNEANGYKDDELQINNPVYANFQGYEVREYGSMTNARLIERRAVFDLLQAQFQGRRAVTIETALEGVLCERGDLIGVVTDLLNDAESGARIRTVHDETTFTIDQRIPAESTESLFDVDNIFQPDNIFRIGEQTICLISTPEGTIESRVVAAEGDTIRIADLLPSLDVAGAHITLGPASRLMRRMIVSEVRRTSEERATVIAVDEAPEIHRIMQERFG